jgi:hypothetical protein
MIWRKEKIGDPPPSAMMKQNKLLISGIDAERVIDLMQGVETNALLLNHFGVFSGNQFHVISPLYSLYKLKRLV